MKRQTKRVVLTLAMILGLFSYSLVPDASAHTTNAYDSYTYVNGANCAVSAERTIDGWYGADWGATGNAGSCDSMAVWIFVHPNSSPSYSASSTSYAVTGFYSNVNNYDTWHFGMNNGSFDYCILGTSTCA